MKTRRKLTKKKPKPKSKKLTLKRAAKALANLLWVHLIKLPEQEREQQIAYVERALSKKLKRFRGTKMRRS
jgi:hypothetical protein